MHSGHLLLGAFLFFHAVGHNLRVSRGKRSLINGRPDSPRHVSQRQQKQTVLSRLIRPKHTTTFHRTHPFRRLRE